MDSIERENKIIHLKKQLKENYQKQKKLGIVGGGRKQFLNYTKEMINDLDLQSQQTNNKETFEIIKNQKARIKKYRNDTFFFF